MVLVDSGYAIDPHYLSREGLENLVSGVISN